MECRFLEPWKLRLSTAKTHMSYDLSFQDRENSIDSNSVSTWKIKSVMSCSQQEKYLTRLRAIAASLEKSEFFKNHEVRLLLTSLSRTNESLKQLHLTIIILIIKLTAVCS